MIKGWLLAAALLALAVPAGAQPLVPCGADDPCPVAGGDYHLAVPAGWDGISALPALIFFHGHRSSGISVIQSGSLRAAFGDHGYLIIAPNGDMLPGRDYRAWPARPGGGLRDDVAFTVAVVEDVAARLPLDRERTYVAGFSAGGSMAWMVACYQGARYAGYVSVAGALRRPVPEGACPGGPARLLQFHGFTDGQVPLEGRAIGDWHQGDVWESLALLRRTNACRSNPTDIAIGDRYWCRSWTGCSAGPDIQFCLHEGGHGLPAGWTGRARSWLEAGVL